MEERRYFGLEERAFMGWQTHLLTQKKRIHVEEPRQRLKESQITWSPNSVMVGLDLMYYEAMGKQLTFFWKQWKNMAELYFVLTIANTFFRNYLNKLCKTDHYREIKVLDSHLIFHQVNNISVIKYIAPKCIATFCDDCRKRLSPKDLCRVAESFLTMYINIIKMFTYRSFSLLLLLSSC